MSPKLKSAKNNPLHHHHCDSGWSHDANAGGMLASGSGSSATGTGSWADKDVF